MSTPSASTSSTFALSHSTPLTRRGVLGGASLLGAGLAFGGGMGIARRAIAQAAQPSAQPGSQPSAPPVALTPEEMDTKFATLVPINTWAGGGVWAIISKWGPTVTLCNGGIIVGKDATVVVEGFNSPAGSAWASKLAKRLSGRDPSHVIVTHYHFDHTDGLSGYLALPEAPTIISTSTTRELMGARGVKGGANLFFPAQPSRFEGLSGSAAKTVLPDTVITDSSRPLTIDLGGRTITLRERAGHTASDLNLELEGAGKDGQKVVFAGDMIFNKVFPVYLDALPKTLRKNVAEVIAEDGGRNVIVPGHGGLTTGSELKPFLAVIDLLSEQGAKAKAAGKSAKDAAAAFVMPEALKDYASTNPAFTELAFAAVFKELDGGAGK